MKNILYITYDGICEPLGISQSLSYLEKLSPEFNIHIISYEKKKEINNSKNFKLIKKRLAKAGITCSFLKYHINSNYFAKIYDIFIGILITLFLTRKLKINIIHVRSYLPGLIALPSKLIFNPKILFDIRGFWADERLDGGLWSKNSLNYFLVKILEIILFSKSDHIVTLTEASLPFIKKFKSWGKAKTPVSVIPTCVNLNLFNLSKKPKVNKDNNFTFGYLGSFGTWYLLDETLQLFKEISKLIPDAKMLIINRNEHKEIRIAAKKAKIDQEKISIYKLDYKDVPTYLRKMDASSTLIKPCFSKLSSSPTKLGEYLGCGIPCVGNSGVGDVEKILNFKNSGFVLKKFDNKSLVEAAKKIIVISKNKNIPYKCRDTAIEFFSLKDGIEKYRLIYNTL